MSKEIVVLSAVRTPMGGFQGSLSGFTAPQLGAEVVKAAIERAGIQPAQVDEVLLGCVLPAGLGQAPARQAALAAGVPDSVPCTTVNKVCGSGMKTLMQGAAALKLGEADVVVAGGMESMSQAPYLMPAARTGLRMGHGAVKDHMFTDGLEDAYSGKLMGVLAQQMADKRGVTREAMDNFAINSLAKANAAIAQGAFEAEIVPVTVVTRSGNTQVCIDEQPGNAKPEKIPGLRPAFAKDGTITAANSSSISDGAAALVLSTADYAAQNGCNPLARIVSYASHAQAPEEFTVAPVGAIRKAIDLAGWTPDDIDLFEVNEAFAMVTLLAIEDVGLDSNKVNVHGGACALGHPLGASGARVVVSLIHALRRYGKKRGLAALCIGGGEGVAMTVELID
ncbi:acetyl-CoA C-acyltransferase [Plesiomonas shigelloides]|uniref:thiolase family protein n=1 Tax=Plesiomonas shigelloides TaxID=703 RepID=UPI000D577329|nr:thiolase family protein [Plesiomonas shigelloides]PVU66391.1 acetyl-CoA C-acyltransferase [Plesiomonas shigelloides]